MKKEKFDKPLAKGICPKCEIKMVKSKIKGWYCLKCGTKIKYGDKK